MDNGGGRHSTAQDKGRVDEKEIDGCEKLNSCGNVSGFVDSTIIAMQCPESLAPKLK